MLEKIKNNKITFIVTGILLVLFGIGLSMSPEYSVSPSQDAPSQEVVVNNEYGFKEITMADALSTWRDNKSAVIVFGFTSCPWCQEAYPVLDKVADEKNVDIFYVRTRDEEGELTYTDE